MNAARAHREQHVRALTLVELVVVLSILAITTTVAVRSLGPIRERTRFDSTESALAELDRALLGGADVHSGFVADIGRLPLPAIADQSVVEVVFEPRELWLLPSPTTGTQASPMGASAVHLATEDADVAVATGWRGPYVQLAPGDDSLRDGYGHAIVCRRRIDAGSGAVTYFALVSRGANGELGTIDDPGDDRVIVLVDRLSPNPIDRVFAELAVTVVGVEPSGTSPLTVNVTVYGPDSTTGGALALVPMAATTQVATLPASIVFPLSLGLTRGPKVVRAYVHTGATSTPQDSPFKSAPTATTLSSGGHALVVESTVPP